MKLNTRDMILTSLFAALTGVGAYISIPIGQVPITLQTLFTLLSGVMLGSKLGALSQIIYVILGLIGIPVFAGGTGGIGTVFSPSFGFLIAFIIGSFVIGKIVENKEKVSVTNILIACIIGTIIIYLIGIPYLYVIMTKVMGAKATIWGILKKGCLIFIPGDVLKCVLVAGIGSRAVGVVKRSNLAQ